MSSGKLEINCNEHGKGVASVVCGHLIKNNGVPLGFVENNDEPGDFQGWCYACEHLYQLEGEMTERFKEFNRMAVVCESCYERIKLIHSIKP